MTPYASVFASSSGSREANRSKAAARASAHLGQHRGAVVDWDARIEELAIAVARARLVFDADGRDEAALLPGVMGEALLRGLETLAYEHGLGVMGEPLLLDRALVMPEDRTVFESAAMAREAALLARSDLEAALSQLARSFPSLRRGPVDGVREWDAEALDEWACVNRRSVTQRASAAFVLWVSSRERAWSAKLDFASALGEWDRAHLVVVAVWFSDPWWGEPAYASPPTGTSSPRSPR